MPAFLNPIAQDVYDLCGMNQDREITNAQFIELLKQHNKLPEEEPETSAYERRAYIGVMNDERDAIIKELKRQRLILTFARRGVFRLDSYEDGLAVKWERNATGFERRTLAISNEMVKTLEEVYGEIEPDLKLDLLEQIAQSIGMAMSNARTTAKIYSMIKRTGVVRPRLESQMETE